MNAVTVIDKKARVDLQRCIGCGACVVTCKEKAIKLAARDRQKIPAPDSRAMHRKIFMERYGPLKVLGKAAKMIVSGKL
jgi:ferredoxin